MPEAKNSDTRITNLTYVNVLYALIQGLARYKVTSAPKIKNSNKSQYTKVSTFFQ